MGDKQKVEVKESGMREPTTDSVPEKPLISRGYRRSQPQRTSAYFMQPQNELLREQEKKMMLRKKATEKYNTISANFKTQVQNESYKYIILPGNNSGVIKRCMQVRTDWEETANFNTMFNFKWQQTSQGIRFDQISTNGKKQMVNHFAGHSAITTKDSLFKNMSEHLKEKVFEYVPLTFCIKSHSEDYQKDLNAFKSVYNIYERNAQNYHNVEEIALEVAKHVFTDTSMKKNSRVKANPTITLPSSHFDGYNYWFLKATRLNRGRGIYVFDTLEKLVCLIKELEEGVILSQLEAQNVLVDLNKEKVDGTFSNIS